MEGAGDGVSRAGAAGEQPLRTSSSVVIAASLRRMGGEPRYHDFVVFTTDPWFMLSDGEGARSRDLTPVRPVRPEPAGAPLDDGRTRRCWSSRRRICRL